MAVTVCGSQHSPPAEPVGAIRQSNASMTACPGTVPFPVRFLIS